MDDLFIDHFAKKLTPKAQQVFVCLSRHCNRSGETIISIRKMAELLGISPMTVQAAIKELTLCQLVAQKQSSVLCQIRCYTVLSPSTICANSQLIEGSRNYEGSGDFKNRVEENQKAIAKVREALAQKGIVKK